ncbi:MAG: efflux RND transporter periplasmic adaptor subunit [Thermoanaerobaculum sp.]
MKTLVRAVWALVFVGLLLLVACGGQQATGVRYHCPMHPTYVTDKPGDCPICGMRLVPIEEKTAPTTVPSYVCPMHPEVVSEKPGRCPKCGMKLVPKATAEPETPKTSPVPGAERKILDYRNPMDPTITSPVPMKDSMGMDYVPVYADEVQPAPGPKVEGYAPVSMEAAGIARSGIQTVVAVTGTLGEAIRAVGTVVPDERLVTHVHTKVSGWIERLFVNFTGQYVKKGEPLLEIYSPELLASQEEYLRAKALSEQLAASASKEAKKAAHELATAAAQRLVLLDVPQDFLAHLDATKTPSRTVILCAPTAGYVLAKGTFAGQKVEPGMELYMVVDLSRLWVEADFYEQEAAMLEVGIPTRVTLPYRPGTVFTGPITYIDPIVNPESRTVRVRVELANPGGELKPDMYANVEVMPEPKSGVIVPDSAVMDTGTRQIAFVEAQPGFFVPREITVARRAGGQALVTQGLAAGERVVAKGTFLLDSESRLRAALSAPQEKSHDQAPH